MNETDKSLIFLQMYMKIEPTTQTFLGVRQKNVFVGGQHEQWTTSSRITWS